MPVTYRRGTVDDRQSIFEMFGRSVLQSGNRLDMIPIGLGRDPQVIQDVWVNHRSLFEHLSRTSDNFWVAEEDGKVIGFARSILRNNVRQLTEFLVLPEYQPNSIDGELLARVFPADGSSHRFALATLGEHALQRYLKATVYPLFPSSAFTRSGQQTDFETDLLIEKITPSALSLGQLMGIDKVVLGFHREAEHAWLIQNRGGYLYKRNGRAVGYGYIGEHDGPFALLDANDFPAVLAHAEREAAKQTRDFQVQVPLINRSAMDHLLRRGFEMESSSEFFLADAPFGKFENYIFSNPPFFV